MLSQITDPEPGQSSVTKDTFDDPLRLVCSKDQLYPGPTTNLQSSGKCLKTDVTAEKENKICNISWSLLLSDHQEMKMTAPSTPLWAPTKTFHLRMTTMMSAPEQRRWVQLTETREMDWSCKTALKRSMYCKNKHLFIQRKPNKYSLDLQAKISL